MKLTTLMHVALEDVSRRQEGLRRTFDDEPGRPSWPQHPATLAALVRRGFVEQRDLRNRKGYRVQAWFVTDAGRKALEPVLVTRRDVPLYLARSGAIRYRKLANGRWAVDDESDGSGDYTTDPSRSIDHDQMPGSKRTAAVAVLVGPADVASFAEHARKREQKRRREAGKVLDAQSSDERLEQARHTARDRRMDISREERLIRYMIANDREPDALRRLVLIEIKLGQRAA